MNEPDPGTRDHELADYYDTVAEAHEQWGEPEPVDTPARLDVTFSVRFTASEIAAIRAQAAEAGLKPTTYIRQVALAAEHTPIDRARLTRTIEALSRDLDELRRAAS